MHLGLHLQHFLSVDLFSYYPLCLPNKLLKVIHGKKYPFLFPVLKGGSGFVGTCCVGFYEPFKMYIISERIECLIFIDLKKYISSSDIVRMIISKRKRGTEIV